MTEAARDKLALHSRRLLGAMLEQQPALMLEVLRREADDRAQAGQGVLSGCQGDAGLVPQRCILQSGIACGNVGRIAHDEPKAQSPHGLVPAALQEAHALQVQGSRIGARHLESPGRDIRGGHFPPRPLLGQGQRDRTTAGAKIQHTAPGQATEGERPLDEQLRLRSRDEDGGSHRELERPELPCPDDVRERLPCRAAIEQRSVAGLLGRLHPVLAVGAQPGAIRAEDVREEQLRIEASAGRVCRLPAQAGQSFGEQGVNSVRVHAGNIWPMSIALNPPPLSVARSLDAALRIFRASLLRCLPYGVLTVLAGHLPNLYNLVSPHVARSLMARPIGWWALNILSAILLATLWNATLLRLAAAAAGRRTAPAYELLEALRRAPAVLGLVLVIVLVGCILGLPVLLLPVASRPWAFLVAACAVTYLCVTLSYAWVAVVVGHQTVLQSMASSIQLVRGNWWRIAAVYGVGAAMLLVLGALASVLVAVVVPLVGRDDLALISTTSEDVVVALLAAAIPFCTALPYTLFEELSARQGVGALAAAPE